MNDAAAMTKPELSRWRAWFSLVRISWRRQARAHLMVWIAAGLMLFLALAVALLTNLGAWDMRTWRQPRRGGLTYPEWVLYLRFAPQNVLSQRQPSEGFKPPQRPSDRWAILYQHHQLTQPLPPEHQAPPPPAVLVADPVQVAVSGAVAAILENEAVRRQYGLVRFSQTIVFAVFASFLLPLCSLSFA